MMRDLTTGTHGLWTETCTVVSHSIPFLCERIISASRISKGELTRSDRFIPGALLQGTEMSPRADQAKQGCPEKRVRQHGPGPTSTAIKASNCVEKVIEHSRTQRAPALLHAGDGRPLVLHPVVHIHCPYPQRAVKPTHGIHVACHEHHTCDTGTQGMRVGDNHPT